MQGYYFGCVVHAHKKIFNGLKPLQAFMPNSICRNDVPKFPTFCNSAPALVSLEAFYCYPEAS